MVRPVSGARMAPPLPPVGVVAVSGWDDDWCDEPAIEYPRPDLIETENPVVAELLGPDGAPIRQWRERRTIPFGFQRPAKPTRRGRIR